VKLDSLLRLENMATGVWRQFYVHVFEGRLTVEDMARIEAVAGQWARNGPSKRVELVVIYPSEARMDADERARMAGIIKKWEHLRSASATVVLASGLMGSMHRSVLTGLQLIAPSPHPTKVFGSTADAVAWLAPHVQALAGEEATGPALAGAVEAFAEAFRASRAQAALPEGKAPAVRAGSRQ
jgi:hypothetical protein